MITARTATPPAAPPAMAPTLVLLCVVTTTLGALVGVVKALVIEPEFVVEPADNDPVGTLELSVFADDCGEELILDVDVAAADEEPPVAE